MPLYEYACPKCETRFELLRPVGRMDEAAPCPRGHTGARRVLSTFAVASRDSMGEAEPVGGGGCGGGCSGCNCSVN